MSTKKNNEATVTTICLPGAEHWELWESVGGGAFSPASTGASGGPGAFKEATVYGIPVTSAFSVPIWVASDDPDLVDGVLDIQLESMGLKPENFEGEHLSRRIVAREEKRTLLGVTVLPKSFSIDLPKLHPEQFFASPELYVLPDNQVTIWKELGKLVMAVTRMDGVIYFQGLTARVLDVEAAREISCAVMQLQAQGTIESLEGVSVWLEPGEIADGATESLERALQTGVLLGGRPAPALPLIEPVLLPQQVAEGRRLALQRKQVKRIATVATLVYAVIVVALGAKLFLKGQEVDKLRSEVAGLSKSVGWIPGMKVKWMDYQQTIDPDTYPLETLRRIYAKMPATGVRFKRYDDSLKRVVIVGEAQDQTAAIRFKNAISNSKDLKRYRWSGPPPRIGRSRTAEFTLTGVLVDDGETEG